MRMIYKINERSVDMFKNRNWTKTVLFILILSMLFLVGCSDDVDVFPETDEGFNMAEEDIELDDGESEEVISEEPDEVLTVDGDMEVHFIDVGQGDSVLVKQDGMSMLIDAGESWAGEKVINYLEGQGVDSLDYVIGTHPHADHIGGLPDVINHFSIGKIIMPEITHTTKTFERLITAIKDNNLSITSPNVGDVYSIGGGNFTIVGPNSNSYNNLNDYSIMLRLEFGENSFMLTGDAEKAAEAEAVANGEILESDVLKLGHHGSNTSTTNAFLKAVNPSHAVVQVGADNNYGHPSPETMSKLEAKGIDVFRNDIYGNIIAISDGSEIRFESQGESTISDYNKSNNTSSKSSEKIPQPSEVVEKDNVESNYIGNKNSKVLHISSCGSLPNENNRVYFESKDEGVNQGFKPCGICKP